MITETTQGLGSLSLPLTDDIPRALLRELSLRTYGFPALCVFGFDISLGDVPNSDLLGLASYTGILTRFDDDMRSLQGKGPLMLLGDENGKTHTRYVAPTATFTQPLEDHLTGYIGSSNGLTAGNINASSTPFKIKAEPGDDPRTLAVHACAVAPGGPYELRVNTDFTIDVDQPGDLYTQHRVIVTRQPTGRSGHIVALQSPGLRVVSQDIDDWENARFEDWDHGTLPGSYSETAPAGYRAPDGDRMVQTGYDTASFRQPNIKNLARIAARMLDDQDTAHDLAERQVARLHNVREQIAIDVDVHNPWRYMHPGDTIWAFDPLHGLVDRSNQIELRGDTTFPSSIRFYDWRTPFRKGYRAFVRRWALGGWQWIDITRWVNPEDGPTQLGIGARKRRPQMVAA